MSSIYEEHKDEDGFLYITYADSPPPSTDLWLTNWQILGREHLRSILSEQTSRVVSSFDALKKSAMVYSAEWAGEWAGTDSAFYTMAFGLHLSFQYDAR
jgi:hypothetical protein